MQDATYLWLGHAQLGLGHGHLELSGADEAGTGGGAGAVARLLLLLLGRLPTCRPTTRHSILRLLGPQLFL